ncbi:MAG TPA: hypothetical protein VNN72_05015 [Polyangiaceae bacterium]|nr:hypothetical protein [Polyangiaceae bacterium]
MSGGTGGGSGHGGSSGAGGSSAMGGSSGSGGSSAMGGSSGTAAEVPACNDLVLDAPDHFLSLDSGPPPTAKGGDLVEGTYFLTRSVWYEQAGSLETSLGRAKMVLTGTTWQGVEDLDSLEDDDSLEPTRYSTFDVATRGATFMVTQTCPKAAATQTMEYTAEGNTLTLYIDDSGALFGQVFERQ